MIKTIHLWFEPALTPLLPPPYRDGEFDFHYRGPQSIKHLIESLGIPHTEIGEIECGDRRVDLSYLPRSGDRLRVWLIRHPEPGPHSPEPRFILDNHLGRLTAHLRMLGLDALYRNDFQDDELIARALQEGRILLSRDRRLLMHKALQQGCLLYSLDPEEQLRQVIERYHLLRWVRPFRRCLRCNHPLEPVEKEAILDRLLPLTRLYYDEFSRCPACDQIYWKGSHYERMERFIRALQEGK
ncbi:MAG: Mut7-C RNAse domain-containing protein [Anaerolineales bacterium]